MSDCGMVRSLLLSWVDEKLPEDLKGQVAEHLASCGACAGLEKTYRATARLGTWPDEEIPVSHRLAEAVREAVETAKKPETEDDSGEQLVVPPKPV
jgi:anti-sigma factor RsiW